MTLLERLKLKGPKKNLALDGGGIRGALTLGYLEKIEQILREQRGDKNLKLCDYFDLIGGTSTGSIIAAGLAIGMMASEVKNRNGRLGRPQRRGRDYRLQQIRLGEPRPVNDYERCQLAKSDAFAGDFKNQNAVVD